MDKKIFVLVTLITIVVSSLSSSYVKLNYADQIEPVTQSITTEEPVEQTPAETIDPITYTDLGVPTEVNTSFKTYMDYRAITNTSSDQYKLIKQYGWRDWQGFMRVSGERDLGVNDDYYMIALGSYYGTKMGTKYRITTSTGQVFYGILSDAKADCHTNSTNQYSFNNDVVEFLVDTRYLNSDVKRMGSANVYAPLNGTIAKIERMDFTE